MKIWQLFYMLWIGGTRKQKEEKSFLFLSVHITNSNVIKKIWVLVPSFRIWYLAYPTDRSIVSFMASSKNTRKSLANSFDMIYGFITCVSHVFIFFFFICFFHFKDMQSVFLCHIKLFFQNLFVYSDLKQKLLGRKFIDSGFVKTFDKQVMQFWIKINNLFVTSKNEIHEFKVLHKGQRAF